MQIINSNLFTILIPEKGYDIIDKETGKKYKKLYLGVNDSIDRYGEIINPKYVNLDYVMECEDNIDTLLLTIDELFLMIEPILAMIPSSASIDADEKQNKFVDFYIKMVNRGLKNIDEVPEMFREKVKNNTSEQ